MRDHNRTADDEADRKRLEHLGTRDVFFGAAGEMVRHAIVAAENERCNEAEQLLGFHVQRAGFVRARIEREKSIDDEISLAQDLSIHSLAKLAKLLQRTWIAMLVWERGGTAVRLRRSSDGSRALRQRGFRTLLRSLTRAQNFQPLSVLIAFSSAAR
jgi:hypothetical protein